LPNFFAKFFLIHSMCIPKINTFVLQGATNTGKSLLLSLLLKDTHPTHISREKDRSTFHFDQLPNSTSVISEEPIIDQTTIGTRKLLLEGSPLPTDMKHTDKEFIHRLPIFSSTNHNLWNWVGSTEVAPIKQRIFEFFLQHPIQNIADEDFTIPSPPNIVTKHDVYALINSNTDNIMDTYNTITSSHPLHPSHKSIPQDTLTSIQKLHIQLLLQDQDPITINISDG
jgi:hypothetical protein